MGCVLSPTSYAQLMSYAVLKDLHQTLMRLLSIRHVHQFSTAFQPLPLVWLMSARYVHQFSTAFQPLPLVWLMSARYVHQFSLAGSCAYLAVYEQSSLVEHAALKVKGQISSDILALCIDALLC